jgi:hypothetical protein
VRVEGPRGLFEGTPPAERYPLDGTTLTYVQEFGEWWRSRKRGLRGRKQRWYCALDRSFYARQLRLAAGASTIIDNCGVFAGLQKSGSILHMARRIIVPGRCIEQAERVVRRYAATRIAALESIPA